MLEIVPFSAVGACSSDVVVSLDTGSREGSRLAPSLFVDLPYSPSLLLDARFGAELTDEKEFVQACEEGFDCYFGDMYDWNEDGTDLSVFVDRFYTWEEVKEEVVSEVTAIGSEQALWQRVYGPLSVAWCAGFVLGWLSALALTDRALALRGLALFEQGLGAVQRDIEVRLLRSYEVDGWPLDA